MANDPQLVSVGNWDEDFYPLVGPFLSRREIVKELGSPVWNDEGKVWIVAIAEGVSLGIVAFKPGKVTELCSDWVDPSYRRIGTYRALFNRRLKLIGSSRHMRATVTEAALPMYFAAGFIANRRNGRYTEVMRIPSATEVQTARPSGSRRKVGNKQVLGTGKVFQMEISHGE